MAKTGNKNTRTLPEDDSTMADEAEGQDRSPRATRDSEARPLVWSQPDMLPMPEAQEGWAFRWVRTSTYGEEDNRNVSMRFREGWEPCKAEDHPELMVVSDHGSEWGRKGLIEVGGLLLCKAPAELMESRKRHHEEMTNRQVEAIDDNMMRQSDSRAPMFKERKTRVSFGSG